MKTPFLIGPRLYFRKEGVQRAQHFLEGRYEDGVLMGILRSEWTPLTLPSAADREPVKG